MRVHQKAITALIHPLGLYETKSKSDWNQSLFL